MLLTGFLFRRIFIVVLFTSKDFPATDFTVDEKAMPHKTNNQTREIKEAIHIILSFSLHSDRLCPDPVVVPFANLPDYLENLACGVSMSQLIRYAHSYPNGDFFTLFFLFAKYNMSFTSQHIT